MNPSIINRKQIITKFNLEKIDISDKDTKIINNEIDNNEIDILESVKKEPIQLSKNVDNISLDILSRLPSMLQYSTVCCNEYNYYIKQVTNSSLPPTNSKKKGPYLYI